MTDNPTPPDEAPKNKYTVNASGKGVVVGDFNSVVQNFLADPRLRWYLLALGILILATSAALYFLLAPRSDPRQWNGAWHIAVADFVVEGAGSGGERDLGSRVAGVVYSTLSGEMREMIAENQIEVRGPARVGQVSGATPQERADSAARIARAIDAHLVVYGTVKVSGLDYTIVPEFYINPNPNALNPAEDRELTGPYALGAPQDISGPVEAGFDQELRQRMSQRLQILAVMSMGMANFSTQRYDLALSRFEEARALPWPDDMSREILYLMIGNATGKVGQDAFTHQKYDLAAQKFQQAEDLYGQAEQEYQKSHPGEAAYPRALIGRGSVAYMRVLLSFNRTGSPADIDRETLARSAAYYQSALDAPNPPPGADVAENAAFGLGQCSILQTLAGELPDYAKAIQEFQSVIQSYEQSKAPRLQEMAGDAHARLGLIYRLQGDKASAIREYQAAVDLLALYPRQQQVYLKPLEERKK